MLDNIDQVPSSSRQVVKPSKLVLGFHFVLLVLRYTITTALNVMNIFLC